MMKRSPRAPVVCAIALGALLAGVSVYAAVSQVMQMRTICGGS